MVQLPTEVPKPTEVSALPATGQPEAGIPGGLAAADSAALSTAELASWVARLAALDTGVHDAERIEQLQLLERVKAACAAAQARVTAAFAASQRAEQSASGVPAHRVGSGVAAQVALARRDSPARGGRHLGLAEALVHEMPHTLDALERGETSEWRATVLVRETACLTREHRAAVDRALAGRLGGLGDRQTQAEARRVGYRLDPAAITRRAARAEAARRVTIRPAPDTMAVVTGLLPVAQGVAVHSALVRAADRLRAQGDARSRGQIMADELVTRVTGQTTAAAVPVEVRLVMTDTGLLAGDPTPAHLDGYGPMPATLARRLATQSNADCEVATWVRRLYTRPGDGALVVMDSRRRLFPAGMKAFVGVRDQVCRTPWCEAPIRHVDHPRPFAAGGATSLANSQGLCEACNYAKQAPGWASRVTDDERHLLEITTPTRHTYTSRPPPLPCVEPRPRAGPRSRAAPGSALEHRLATLVAVA